jgi:hypothetical protein
MDLAAVGLFVLGLALLVAGAELLVGEQARTRGNGVRQKTLLRRQIG